MKKQKQIIEAEFKDLLTEYGKIYEKAKREKYPSIKEVIEQKNKQYKRFFLILTIAAVITWCAFFLLSYLTGNLVFAQMDFNAHYVVMFIILFIGSPMVVIAMYIYLIHTINNNDRDMAISPDELQDIINNTKYSIYDKGCISCKEYTIGDEEDNEVRIYQFKSSNASGTLFVKCFCYEWERPLKEQKYKKELTEIVQLADTKKSEQVLTEICYLSLLQAYVDLLQNTVKDNRLLTDLGALDIRIPLKGTETKDIALKKFD